MFELKPDFEDVLNRYEAWWECEIIDRPLVCMTFPKQDSEKVPLPARKEYSSLREKWMDAEYIIESAEASFRNRVHFADALPIAWPNLGPEIFSAFYGCPMKYGESTAWSEPILDDWSPESVDKLQVDKNGFYFRKIMEMMDVFIEAGRDKFIVGYTDLHPGGDAIAAFRDPQQLCIDMIEHSKEVKSLCDRITDDFLEVYDIFYEKLSAAGMPSTTWLGAICKGKYHVPSNDFSCMISNEMFERIFLPGIIRECQHMNRCIYHLDGPQALRYLDLLLEIPEIHAIQWVPGTGQDHWSKWIEVYQHIQKAGKAFCISVSVDEFNRFSELIYPEGVLLGIGGIKDQETAHTALKAVEGWAVNRGKKKH